MGTVLNFAVRNGSKRDVGFSRVPWEEEKNKGKSSCVYDCQLGRRTNHEISADKSPMGADRINHDNSNNNNNKKRKKERKKKTRSDSDRRTATRNDDDSLERDRRYGNEKKNKEPIHRQAGTHLSVTKPK